MQSHKGCEPARMNRLEQPLRKRCGDLDSQSNTENGEEAREEDRAAQSSPDIQENKIERCLKLKVNGLIEGIDDTGGSRVQRESLIYDEVNHPGERKANRK